MPFVGWNFHSIFRSIAEHFLGRMAAQFDFQMNKSVSIFFDCSVIHLVSNLLT